MNEHKEKWHGHEGMPDPEKLKEILDAVAEKIPRLLKGIGESLYSPKNAKGFAEAAATFYKELKSAGMTEEQAFKLTSQYLSTLGAPGKMMDKFWSGEED
jgi:phosphotransacetylase